MSTRANIVIIEGSDKLIFYRHSDGYPEVTGESLKKFVAGYKDQMRCNISQSAGWLILHGHIEYMPQSQKYPEMMGWKVGAYEPTTCIHSDIEYLYEIDLVARTLKGFKHNGTKKGKLVLSEVF